MMRELRAALVATVAVLAFGALTAASASASGPVWVACAKAMPKNTGAYTDKACATESPTHEGKYELVEGIGRGRAFKGTAPSVKFEYINEKFDLFIECSQNKISGRYAAPDRVAGVQISMKECTLQPFDVEKGCQVHTAPLSGRLGWIDQAKGEAGLELTSGSEPETGLFVNISGCFEPHLTLKISGSVILHIGPTGALTNQRTLSATFGWTERPTKEGHCKNLENLPGAFEGEEANHVLTGEAGFGPVVCDGAALYIPQEFPMHIEKGETLMIR